MAYSTGSNFKFATLYDSDFVYEKGWVSQDRNPRFCYDIDGDGKADLIGFADNGVYVQYTRSSTGAITFGPKTLVSTEMVYNKGWTSFNKFPRCLGRVSNACSGAGADIIGFASNGVYMASYNGRNFDGGRLVIPGQYGTDASAGGWTTYDDYPRMCADMNGDGRTDIVGFGPGKNYIQYAISDGSFGMKIDFLFTHINTFVREDIAQMSTGYPNFNSNPR